MLKEKGLKTMTRLLKISALTISFVFISCEIPENLKEQEIKILSQGMSEDEAKKNKAKFTETAKTRIKTGLILNEFGQKNDKIFFEN